MVKEKIPFQLEAPAGGYVTDAGEISMNNKPLPEALNDAFADNNSEILDNIRPIVVEGDVDNAPDEEDLTSVEQGGTAVLRIKDRPYIALSRNGMGFKILRKGISLSEQMSDINTIYEIRYDFDLNNGQVEIPSGSLLHFVGGSISNGTIVGNNTRIDARSFNIFKRVTLNGSFTAEQIKVSWWLTHAYSDDTNDVQSMLDSVLRFQCKNVFFDKPVLVTDVGFCSKYGPQVVFVGNADSRQTSYDICVYGTDSQGLDISGTTGLVFENFKFVGGIINQNNDYDDIPKTLLYMARSDVNPSGGGHSFKNVMFTGSATIALIYNYAGEIYHFNSCTFSNRSSLNSPECLVYNSATNSKALSSKFTTYTGEAHPCTCLRYVECSFADYYGDAKGLVCEGSDNSSINVSNCASISIYNCYFFVQKDTTIECINVQGGISILNCIDESGARINEQKTFLDIKTTQAPSAGQTISAYITKEVYISGNTLYLKNCKLLDASTLSMQGVVIMANYIYGSNNGWLFGNVRSGSMVGIRDGIEYVSVAGTSLMLDVANCVPSMRGETVQIKNRDYLYTPTLGSNEDYGFQSFYHVLDNEKLDLPIWWNGSKWKTANNKTPCRSVGTGSQRPSPSDLEASDYGLIYANTDTKVVEFLTRGRWCDALGKPIEWLNVGESNQRPQGDNWSVPAGYQFYNQTSGKPIYRDSGRWNEADGARADVKRIGSTSNRPSFSDIYHGFRYYDTTLNMEIIADSSDKWVDAMGRTPGLHRGTASNMPDFINANPTPASNDNGYPFYLINDSVYGTKLVFWCSNGGTNGGAWVDAAGNIIIDTPSQ